MHRLRGTFLIELALAVLVAGLVGFFLLREDVGGDERGAPAPGRRDDRTFETNDWLERACALDPKLLNRIWRGHDPEHSEDVTTVPLAPNYSGTFTITSHSGPWDYLQNVPLVLYGPEQIPARGRVDDPASIVDVYPTVSALTGIGFEERGGRNLLAGAAPAPAPPKLIVVVMWDGVGRNMLERWPDAWPNLARLESEGTSFVNAVVGSSPSITPATHSSLGTGAYPRDHGVTAIEFRAPSGTVRSAFAGRDPGDLELSTFGDQLDRANGNRSIVGMLAWKLWHIGMLGHGKALDGGDADHLALINKDGAVAGNDAYYSTPSGLTDLELLEDHLQEADRSDGEADGAWMSHPVHELHDNPGWVRYENDLLIRMLADNGYGDDAITDVMVTNFKPTDIVGHQYTMDSPEEELVLEAQDEALGTLVDWLDANVGNYVVVLSADHGHTPRADRSGAWPILQGQVREDIDAHFEVPDGRSIVDTTTAVGPFLNRGEMRRLEITGADVAEFLNSYTIADNWNEPELPERFEQRGDEPVFAAAWPADRLDAVMACAGLDPASEP